MHAGMRVTSARAKCLYVFQCTSATLQSVDSWGSVAVNRLQRWCLRLVQPCDPGRYHALSTLASTCFPVLTACSSGANERVSRGEDRSGCSVLSMSGVIGWRAVSFRWFANVCSSVKVKESHNDRARTAGAAHLTLWWVNAGQLKTVKLRRRSPCRCVASAVYSTAGC